jgi:hypothetical protein
VQQVEGPASGGEGGRLAGAGEGHEGNPEGGVFDPGGMEFEAETVTDDAAGTSKEWHGDHDRRNPGEDGGGVEPGFDGRGQEIGGETGIGREGRFLWFGWGEEGTEFGEFGEEVHGGASFDGRAAGGVA